MVNDDIVRPAHGGQAILVATALLRPAKFAGPETQVLKDHIMRAYDGLGLNHRDCLGWGLSAQQG